MRDEMPRPRRFLRFAFCTSVPRLCIGTAAVLLCAVTSRLCGAAAAPTAALCVLLLAAIHGKLSCSARLAAALQWVWTLLACPVGLVLTQLMLNCDLSGMTPLRIALGTVCVLVPVLLALACSGSFRCGVLLGLLLPMALTAGNYYVYRFRGSELTAHDFSALATACAVAGRYSFAADAPFFYAWALAAVYGLLGFALPAGGARRRRLPAAIAAAVGIAVLCFGTAELPVYAYQNEGTVCNGYLLNFLCHTRTLRTQPPQGYDADALREWEAQYACETDAREMPHILVIMNESFADLNVLGTLHTDIAPTPFFDTLRSQTIHGYALSATFGGGTTNAEFQLLTGHNLGFLPDGSYPLQQRAASDSSMFSALARMGYTTAVAHPARAENWMRETVYTRLGVDRLYFEDDFSDAARIRGLVSDAGMYEKLLSLLEEADTPLFLFGITMQNHGGYTAAWDPGDDTVRLSGYDGTYADAEQYLSLLHSSDAALEMLLTRLSAWDEPVFVLFFGDHLPALSEAFYRELQGGAAETLSQQMARYCTPFFIWSNAPIRARDVGTVGQSFLLNELWEAAGLAQPAYRAFLQTVRSRIPAMNALGYYSAAQQTFLPYDAAQGEEAALLEQYRALQYNALFDTEHRSDVFFPAAPR